MSDWRSVAGLSPEEQARIVQLVPFGGAVIQFRAKIAVVVDYEPEALAEKIRGIERERHASEVEAKRKTADDGSWVQPLGSPMVMFPGAKPWLKDVPTTQTVLHDFAIPEDEIEGLGDGIWTDGNDTQTDSEDHRRKRLLIGVEFKMVIPVPGPQTEVSTRPVVPLRRGTAGNPGTGGDILRHELKRRIDAGESIGSWRATARSLHGWYEQNCQPPDYPSMTESGVKQAIGDMWRSAPNRTTEAD